MSVEYSESMMEGMNVKIEEELREFQKELKSVNEEIEKLKKRRTDLDDKVYSLKRILKHRNNSRNALNEYDNESFTWSKDLKTKLKTVFNINSFRSFQLAAINATLAKRDCLLIMPTGGGKSLCFQLPALVEPGLTVVISPLISLMEDQLIGLKTLGIPAVSFSSQTDKDETKTMFNDMIDPKSGLKIVYLTPEKFAKSKRFMSQLEKVYKGKGLSRFVIDEVHSVSVWGHDFRSDYQFLSILKTQFPNTPIIGLTATATESVITDIQKMLNLEGCLLFKDRFYRKNLKYKVIQTTNKDNISEIEDIIKTKFKNKSGIIYCLTVKDTEDVSAKLSSLGISAQCYHAQLDHQLRSKIHKKWYSGETQVIVATIAFGMGINKMDVRFVIHYSISKSVENYYQETGRAGRDGQKAYCILFFKFTDMFRASSLFFTERRGLSHLYQMVDYCIQRKTCRKDFLSSYFGDKRPYCNDMCDNCEDSSEYKSIDLNILPICKDLAEIIEHAGQLNERMTALKLIDSWYGKGVKKLRVENMKHSDFSRETGELIIFFLLKNGYLKEEFHFTPYSTISYIEIGSKYLTTRHSTSAYIIVVLREDEIKSVSSSKIYKNLLKDDKDYYNKEHASKKLKKTKEHNDLITIE